MYIVDAHHILSQALSHVLQLSQDAALGFHWVYIPTFDRANMISERRAGLYVYAFFVYTPPLKRRKLLDITLVLQES